LSDRPLIGVDIGGTKIAVAAITPGGQILSRVHGPTLAHASYDSFVAALIELVQEALAAASPGQPLAIGIGCPGPIDPDRGTVHNPYTLPLPDGSDIVSPLHEHFRVPVALEGDAFSAALGEHWLGAARGRELAACVTFGTGIGCGIIRNGRVARGAHGIYPEVGHHAIDPAGPECYCGARGCWETLASGTAIGQGGQEAAQAGESAALLALAGGRPEAVTSEMVFQAAAEGDAAAGRVIDRAVRATAIGVFNVVHFLAPDAVILGGGVMRHYALFEPAIRAMLARITVVPQPGLLLAPAQLGQDAGLFGAARAAMLAVGTPLRPPCGAAGHPAMARSRTALQGGRRGVTRDGGAEAGPAGRATANRFPSRKSVCYQEANYARRSLWHRL
jgi:glucokinase